MRSRPLVLVALLATTLAACLAPIGDLERVEDAGLLGPIAHLEAAPRITLAGEVDSNSPIVWSGGRMLAWTSEPYFLDGSLMSVRRSEGTALDRMSAPSPVSYADEIDGARWLEAVWQAEDGVLYGWYHNEPFGTCPGRELTKPRIGAVRSFDEGLHWESLVDARGAPFVLEAPEPPNCDATNGFFAGGHGDFSVVEEGDFLWFFFSSYGAAEERGVALARMRIDDRDDPVGRVWKWRDGAFGEPGVGGHVTPILPARWDTPGVDALWGPSVHWNQDLGVWVMLLNHAVDGPVPWWQEGIWIAYAPSVSDPEGWSAPARLLDPSTVVPRQEMEQGRAWYPQVVGLEPGLGTDKRAGARSRFFLRGVSEWELVIGDGTVP